jgi:SPIRAL1-like protein
VGGAHGAQNTGNSIGEIPSVKLHAPPGGSSSIAFGSVIDTTSAPTIDRSDEAALAFLAEVNEKQQTHGKLSVRDFHLIASFPLFEHTYNQNQISRLRYADKVAATPQFLKVLNAQFGAPAPMPSTQFAAPAPMPSVAPTAAVAPQMAFPSSSPGMVAAVPMEAATEIDANGSRTACRGGGAGGMQNVGNSIGDIPSVKLHAPPGGSSSIAFGAAIDHNAAPTIDRSDAAARTFLEEVNAKYQMQGKLGVRDFHLMGSFPLFEQTYNTFRISSMSYAEKVTTTPSLLKALNSICGTSVISMCGTSVQGMPCSEVINTTMASASAQPMDMMGGSDMSGARRTANRSSAGGTGGMQNVGNSIGDIPSVKLHAPPGGQSQIAFG